MRGEKTIKLQASLLAAVASLAFAYPAYAQQSSETFVLQPSAPNTSTSSAQGPVDAQNPVVRPSDAEPPASAPSAAPAPVPTIAAPPPPPETGGTTAPAQRPPARPRAVGPQASVVAPPGSAPPALTGEAPAPTEPDVTATQPAVAPAPAADAATTGLSWWWALVPLGAASLGAFLLLRRRRPVDDADEYVGDWAEPEADEAKTPEAASLVAAPSRTTAPPRPSQPVRPPSPAFGIVPAAPPTARERRPQREAVAESERELIEVEFEPIGLRISLVYATLQYRMTLRASADRPAGHLVGDMISAHASLPQNEQLAPAPETLPLLEAVPAMEAGETSTLKGEIQFPLNAVRPLRKGNASYLVPLIRVYVISDGTAQQRRVYTVGMAGAGAALSPIRLDTGSRTVTGLAAREVEMARHIPLAQRPQRAAG